MSESADNFSLKAAERIEYLARKIDNLERMVAETRSLVGPFGINMGDDTVLVQTIYSVKYFIPIKDDVMTPQLVVYRQWEPEVSSLISSLLHKDSVFVDVGANFGYFTCLAGAKIGVGGSGRVYALEANPKMFQLLCRNTSINWSMAPITNIEIAVSNETSQLVMNVPADRYANASLGSISSDGKVDSFDVQAERLDNLLNDCEKVDLIKIDVEGWEYPVLQGAEKIISENQDIIVIIEWSPAQIGNAQINPEDLIHFMKERKFRFYSIEMKKEMTDVELLALSYGNILMKRSDFAIELF